MNQTFRQAGLVVAIVLLGGTAFAQRGGGGARGGGGGAARTSVNHGGGSYGGNASANRNVNQNVNANRNVNVNQNVNVNRNVNVHGGYGGYGGYDYGHYHPVARGVAVGVAAVGTAAVIGSMVNSLPPSCTQIVNAGVTYQQCGSTWYRPQYSGTSTTYVVVNPP